MADFAIQYTQVGLAALIRARNAGVKAEIAFMALGSGAYTPTGHETALRFEEQRVAISEYQDLVSQGQAQLSMRAVFDGSSSYDINELGIFLNDGTLLGLASHPSIHIGHKAATSTHKQEVVLGISTLPADSLTVVSQGAVPETFWLQDIARMATSQIYLHHQFIKQHLAEVSV